MRLINVHTLALEEYFGDTVPPYAILSHTWGSEEVSYREWTTLTQFRKLDQSQVSGLDGALLELLSIVPAEEIEARSGYLKILSSCNAAKEESIGHVWVDTCCIDKTSSAELSEAINSMFTWYRSSEVCFAYLSDVNLTSSGDRDAIISSSRWFTRGWTLQEFLAPKHLVFFDSSWTPISSKIGHDAELYSTITGIDTSFIEGTRSIETASIAQRMSWASKRRTTRSEDMAYCLLGLFGVNMPLLYGEGKKAFERLQEEILKNTEDHSYLAAGFQLPLTRNLDCLFAQSPADFEGCNDMAHTIGSCQSGVVQMTNKGLRVRMLFLTTRDRYSPVYATLTCCGSEKWWLAFPIGFNRGIYEDAQVWRLPGSAPVLITPIIPGDNDEWVSMTFSVYFRKFPLVSARAGWRSLGFEVCGFRVAEGKQLQLYEIYPPDPELASQGIFTTCADSHSSGTFYLKFAPQHAASSESEYVIVIIHFKATNEGRAVNPTSIQAGVLRANDIQLRNASGYRSLFGLLYGEQEWAAESTTSTLYESKAEVDGCTLSVEVKEAPWIVGIKRSRET